MDNQKTHSGNSKDGTFDDHKSTILHGVNYPQDIKNLSSNDLNKLAAELRSEMINTVSQTGGHLGASLGVVELTIALHYVFDAPKDKMIWDVGHQSYPHKILTGRKSKMPSIRQKDGLAGFTKIKESKYDPFGAGHSSTSISAGLGMAVARDLANDNYEVISIIGDGALSAGMAYEAMNNLGSLKKRMIVILNDNDMSISAPVGAISKYLNKLITSKPFLDIRKSAKTISKVLPSPIGLAAKKAENMAREITRGSNIFEQLGFYYIGVVDGHNLDEVIDILQNIKQDNSDRPYFIHLKTEKGKGYLPAEQAADKYHGIGKFNIATGEQLKATNIAPSYTSVFADNLIKLAKEDKKIVAITAAMPTGTGLDKFAKKFPERCFDVGIAEQHAVTFAAGLATQGFKPFVAIYSTFLQRAYDQIVHDVAVQSLPVRFAIDRAGLVGADGPTHAGSFDLSYLCCLPNMIVMCPSDELELAKMVTTAQNINDKPSAIRYPRGNGTGVKMPKDIKPITVGKANMLQKGKDKIAIMSIGTRLSDVIKCAEVLKNEDDLDITIVDARFAKPVDQDLIKDLAKNNDIIITVEENAVGGFATQFNDCLTKNNLLSDILVKNMYLPDVFIDQGNVDQMHEESKLDYKGIISTIRGLQV